MNDMLAHFIVGALVALFAPKRYALELVAGAALFKEVIIDMTANMNNQAIFEPLKDMGFTMLGGMTVILFSVLLKRAVRS
jgi:hypothetical protein